MEEDDEMPEVVDRDYESEDSEFSEDARNTVLPFV